MNISELIERLEGIKKVDGDLEVFLRTGGDNEKVLKEVFVGRADCCLEEDTYLGTGVEDYHQVVCLDGYVGF